MTPNDIEVLIHCHVSSRIHERFNASAVKEAIEMFLKDGMIVEKEPCIYFTTDKGAAHIQQLCHLPVPVKQFIDYSGNVIEV